MVNITLAIPEDLRVEIKQHREVNWSEIARKAMTEHLRKLHIANAIAQKSKLTEKDIKDIDKLVKIGIAKRHGL